VDTVTDNRQTLEASITPPMMEFLERVYRQEMQEPGAFAPFSVVPGDRQLELNPIEKALAVLMADYKSILLRVREDKDLLDQPDVDAEASQVQALRVPDDWEPSSDVQVAEIEVDE